MSKIEFTTQGAGPFFAHPSNDDDNFADWDDNKIEVPGVNGRYKLEVDTSIEKVWYVYQGATAPDSWDDWIAFFDFTSEGGRDWTDEQRERLIELWRLDQIPYEPPPFIVPPLEDVNLVTGYGYTYGSNEQLLGNTDVRIQMIKHPDGTGLLLSGQIRTVTSNSQGQLVATFRVGATYRIWTTDMARAKTFTVPNADFALPNLIRW